MQAKKSLGQNFLRDEDAIRRIVDAAAISSDDTVIEIGPGQGALTGHLIERARQVIAVEFDRDMVDGLSSRFGRSSNLILVNADVLSIDFDRLIKNNFKFQTSDLKLVKVVANLPYNISTPILQRLILQRHLFSSLVLMFQREVVDRITAKPGGKERGFLSVLVENSFTAERLLDVPPSAFVPRPKVWSSVVRLTTKRSRAGDDDVFRNLVSASFAQKRKTLLNNLKHLTPDAARLLSNADIDGSRRAETLTLEEFVRLAEEFSQRKKAGSS